ncbi:RNA polymerase sigma factor [Saltatorellus ferox]
MNDSKRRHQELADLAESTRWAQALACRLVGDTHLAEDVVQDAWLTALQRSAKMASPRAWLAGAIRNLSAGERRDRARRRIREEAASRSEALPAAAETAARLEAQEILIGCLLAIEEPFRRTLIARHVDGLAPREIAAREGVPLSTVNGRLDRGLKRLREGLERKHGGDTSQWMAALVPLIPAKGTTPATMFAGAWMMKNVSIVVVILVALTSWGWRLARPGDPVPPSDTVVSVAVDPIEIEGEREPDLVLPLPPALARQRVDSEPEEALASATPAPEPEVETQATDEHLEGRWIIDDPLLGELRGESGELRLRALSSTGESEVVAVSVQNGCFPLDGWSEGRLLVESATASTDEGNRPIALEVSEFEFDPDVPLVLHGRFLPETTLRVVDARTGEDLGHVNVMPKLPSHAGPEARGPGPHNSSSFLVRDKASPIRLPWERGVRSYWVKADDHAWGFLQVDHETGGESLIALERAGSLDVQTVGPMDALGSALFEIHIRVYQVPTWQLTTSARINDGGRQGFSGIAEGDYEVRIEVGTLQEECTVLGACQVRVKSGEKTTALVEIAGIPSPEVVRVQGSLLVPADQREMDLRLSLRPDPGPTLLSSDVKSIERAAMSERSGALAWNANELTPGPYRFLVEPFQYETVLEIPHTDVETLKIVVPRLFPVHVRIVDDTSDEPVRDATLRWSRGGAARTEDAVSSMDEDGIILLHMPAGPATFSAKGPEHDEGSVDSMIGPGSHRIDLKLPQAAAPLVR